MTKSLLRVMLTLSWLIFIKLDSRLQTHTDVSSRSSGVRQGIPESSQLWKPYLKVNYHLPGLKGQVGISPLHRVLHEQIMEPCMG